MTNITALRNHLSNVIYIENNFGLDLFQSKVELEQEGLEDFEDALGMRKSPSAVAIQTSVDETSIDNKSDSLSNFFGAVQRNSADINILPYYYDAGLFWTQIDSLKKKLSHFPLIIIDWQLEEKDFGKTGIDVLQTIIQDNQILHYYVIYSNEISSAMTSFSQKFSSVKIGELKENSVIALDNAIVMFANKRTRNLNQIIEALENFTIENYGYLPQLFLSVKQQIENKTAALYNEFMGLDSMMLPQLIMDEAYDYEGMQEEVISSIIMNRLRSDLFIDKHDFSYGYVVLDKLLNTSFSEESYNRAIVGVKNSPRGITYELCKERIQKIIEQKCLNGFDFNSLKEASQIFFTGDTREPFENSSEEKKVSKRKEQIWSFILFLSICCDEKYYSKYVKLLSLIKLTEYKDDLRWTIQECGEDIKAKALCQGDVFINETNDSFLMCITPACQLIRPDKINRTYTFLKGSFAKKTADGRQKQIFSTHLIDSNKTKVLLVNWEFFSPIIIDFSTEEKFSELNTYKRCYRLNMEYTHKIVELYSEYIKQIGVEELFGKRIDDKEKIMFLETKGEGNDSN